MKLTRFRFPYSGAEPIEGFTMTSDSGMEVKAISYGAIITDVRVPDANGKMESVVLGFDSLDEYLAHEDLCLGCAVGRIAGRIDGAAFTLKGKDYTVPANDRQNSLHGNKEFGSVLWNGEGFESDDSCGVVFWYTSPAGSNGFPGEVTVKMTYVLDSNNTFYIRYEAQTTETTILNLTNHTYFNLNGDLKATVDNHLLKTPIAEYVELREDCIPTGNKIPVAGTPFDFNQGKELGEGFVSDYPQNVMVKHGYDHPLILDPSHISEDGYHKVLLSCPDSGRVLTLETDYPCVVMYSGNYFDGSYPIRGQACVPHLGVALEAQGYPDAVHHDNFDSVVLQPGDTYDHITSWHFDW